MTTIKIDIGKTDAISNAIEELEKYEQSISIKVERLMERLGLEGFYCVKLNLSDIHWNGKLQNSVNYKHTPNSVTIYVENEYAIFVEFGTGKVGAMNGRIEPLPKGYSYMVGEHIFITKDGKIGWKYYNYKLGKVVFTEGMPPRPFMFRASQELRKRVYTIANEVFRND